MHDSRMKKILSKKRDLSPMEHSAKMDVVKQMRDMASEEMGGKLDGLKKVSVMSNNPKGLAEGLDKAKEIVSNGQMDQMKNHAENDLGDYDAAVQEHEDDESNDDDGSEASFSEGGQVDPMQSAQDSMRKAFKFNEGGEVPSPDMDESEEGYSSREESDDEDPTSPSEEEEMHPENEATQGRDEFEGLDMDKLKAKLREMMKMHRSMGKK